MTKYRGHLRRQNATYQEAMAVLRATDEWYTPPQLPSKASDYLPEVVQGATLVPRSFWFVRSPRNAIVRGASRPQLETDVTMEANAKAPWKALRISGRIEGQFVFGTIIAEDLLPFRVRRFRPVVLPLVRERGEDSSATSRLLTAQEAASRGFMDLSNWLTKVDREYSRRKKETTKLSVVERLNYDSLLSNQTPELGMKVLYNRAGTHLAAAFLDAATVREAGGMKVSGFIADSATYVIATSSREEAAYLVAFLNAPCVDDAIKPYQTRGLFGATSGGGERDIHRRPFEVLAIPRFDPGNKLHKELADLGKAATRKAEDTQDSDARLADLRKMMRHKLRDEVHEIDRVASEVLGLERSPPQELNEETPRLFDVAGHGLQQTLIDRDAALDEKAT